MTDPKPYFGSAEHASDLTRISAAVDPALAERIARYEGTTEDVMTWYGNADPCRETSNLRLIEQRIEGTYSPVESYKVNATAIAESMRVNEAAALTILADVSGVSKGGRVGQPWTADAHPIVAQSVKIAPGRLARRLIEIVAPDLRVDDYEKLYVAADCLHLAGAGLEFMGVEGAKGLIAVKDHAEYLSRSEQYIADIALLSKAMMHQFLTDAYEGERIIPRPIIHRLGALMCSLNLEASCDLNKASDTGPIAVNEQETQVFSLLTSLIGISFLDLEKSKVLKGAEKGDLHELLFLLDVNFLFSTNRPASGSWFAESASQRYDYPKIGYPEKKRGLDFVMSNGTRSVLVQLKSSTQDDSEYHPWILVIEEENFQEVDKRRLGAKINAYQKWINSGYSDEFQAGVEKYVLPSAKIAYEHSLKEGAMPESERIIRALDRPLTRAERRRIKRSTGDFTKRKAK